MAVAGVKCFESNYVTRSLQSEGVGLVLLAWTINL